LHYPFFKVIVDILLAFLRDLALIAAYAKPGINDRGVERGFSSSIKGMARRTLNVHLS